MPAWSGTLPFRQRRTFTHRCDLWEWSGAIPAGELPSDPEYTLALTGVPAYRRTKSAVDSPELVALVEGEDMISTDLWRLPAGTVLGSSWIIVDRSLNPSGSPGLNYNAGWAAKGDPVRNEDWSASFQSGMVEAYSTRLALLPAEIRTYYGIEDPE